MRRINPARRSILGFKINNSVLVAAIILIVFSAYYRIHTMYDKHYLEDGQTEIICAEIIDVGVRHRGGLGVKNKVGYIKFRYFIRGEEFISSSESFEIRENIKQYRVGDCIELIVSLEKKNIKRWNESKGTFKCR